jgi:hypothetical protein
METPYIRIEDSGADVPLGPDVTTIGRGSHVDIRLADSSVSQLHAEIVRRGPYAYVTDFGLSRNGTRVNGRLVAQRLLAEGDVITFGSARCRVYGLPTEDCPEEVELRRGATPELTRRELDVVSSLCRPALAEEAFVAPATAREIAADLVVTEAAVKQHLLRLYQKFRIAEGPNRRARLANEIVTQGLIRPMPPRSEPIPAEADAPALPPGASAPAGAPAGTTGPFAATGPAGSKGTAANRGSAANKEAAPITAPGRVAAPRGPAESAAAASVPAAAASPGPRQRVSYR